MLRGRTLPKNGGSYGSQVNISETTYHKADLRGAKFTPEPDRFYDESYEPNLVRMIDHLIDVEGPVHQDVLIRRIARHHGFQRAGNQIRELVLRLAINRRGKTREPGGFFFWRKGTVKDRLSPARFARRDAEMRKVEYISVEELRAIAQALVVDDPIELARSLGIARLNAASRTRLEDILSS